MLTMAFNEDYTQSYHYLFLVATLLLMNLFESDDEAQSTTLLLQ